MRLRRYPTAVGQHYSTLILDAISPLLHRNVSPSVARPPLLVFSFLRISHPSFLLRGQLLLFLILIDSLLFTSSLVIIEGFEQEVPFAMVGEIFGAVKKAAHVLVLVPRISLVPVGHVLRTMQVVRVLGLLGRLGILRLLLHLLKELPILVFKAMGRLLVTIL